jgi:alpha-N-arabinofuranosidase
MLHAELTIDPGFTIGPIDRRLFGGFVEHLGRGVYQGLYEPGHPQADEDGFRTDVIELVRELGITVVRYPGGNFASGYRWEDTVGPRGQRPRRLDLAWHSTETNEVGLHEFARWADRIGAELMLALNLGTRGTAEALDLLEYCNLPAGTTRAEQRAADGTARPFDVRLWCLGNEMDGPWQLGHRTAGEYGGLAARTAMAMRRLDERVQLVVCGSSGTGMPTFGEWERTVLSRSYEDVDYVSCHAYYEEHDGDLASFLASPVDMDRYIDTVAATIDHVRALKRSDHEVHISFDEWNVWYLRHHEMHEKITGIDAWPVAPRLLEDTYTVADAVVVAGMLISLLRHADRVRIACLAQLVNVIAPIRTEPGGPAWRQTTFHPFALTARLARGVSLQVRVDSPTVATTAHGTVPVIDAAATHDEGSGRSAVFLVNRSTTQVATVRVDARALPGRGLREAVQLADADPHARNTFQDPQRVLPGVPAYQTAGDVVTVTLPPVSWTALSLG